MALQDLVAYADKQFRSLGLRYFFPPILDSDVNEVRVDESFSLPFVKVTGYSPEEPTMAYVGWNFVWHARYDGVLSGQFGPSEPCPGSPDAVFSDHCGLLFRIG